MVWGLKPVTCARKCSLRTNVESYLYFDGLRTTRHDDDRVVCFVVGFRTNATQWSSIIAKDNRAHLSILVALIIFNFNGSFLWLMFFSKKDRTSNLLLSVVSVSCCCCRRWKPAPACYFLFFSGVGWRRIPPQPPEEIQNSKWDFTILNNSLSYQGQDEFAQIESWNKFRAL